MEYVRTIGEYELQRHVRKPFWKREQVESNSNNFFFKPQHIDGPPVQKQPDKTPSTPCPTSVSIGELKAFNHSNLSADEKENWGTYIGVTSKMKVGPGKDHTGHCMKEKLTTVSNNCPEQVHTRGGEKVEPCTGNKCLDINTGSTAGDPLTRSSVTDDATSFIDLHRTRNKASLLEGSKVKSCSVVCEQNYSCDRKHPTSEKFRITRDYKLDSHKRKDGSLMSITTGSIKKELIP